MRLSAVEQDCLVRMVVKEIKGSAVKLTDEETAKNIIKNILIKNMEDEKLLEEEALKLLKKHRQALGASLDEDKALRMIKQKLADEKGFVL